MASLSTFHYQSSLPKLPVPKLQDTFQKYLAAVRPLVDDEQYAKTLAEVSEFVQQDGLAEQLQQYILGKFKSSENWLTDWWTKYVYLKERKSIIFNSSGSMVIGYGPAATEDEYIDLAAKFALKISEYYWKIYTETLEPELVAGKPLCMMQKLYMYAGGRIPKQDMDDFEFQNVGDESISKHIIISHNNRFFAVETIKDDKLISFAEMRKQVKRLIEMSAEESEPIGILTTAERAKWADIYELLLKDPQNKKSIRTILRGISVLSLERNLPEIPVGPDHADYLDKKYSLCTAAGLHGFGAKYSAANRWNDKGITYYLGGYGYYGMLGEHSYMDGAPTFHCNIYLDQGISNFKIDEEVSEEYLNEVPPPQKIEWNLSEDIVKDIRETAEVFDKAVDNVLSRSIVFCEYGKEFIKTQKMSPDSFLQTAFQLVYYMLKNEFANQYESCTLRLFAHGRTENIRSATSKSKELCQIWTSSEATDSEKLAAFVEATKAHNKLAREAFIGQGFDRHLFGLKIAALEKGLPEPKFFKDFSFQRLNQYEISTSQVSLADLSNSNFAPACLHGFGICYNIQPHKLNISCSTFKSYPKNDAKIYLDKLRQFFGQYREMATQLVNGNK
ncbi:Carnitine O-acetyltransferase [Trichoplax sp. H2]|nr:Carnitine O-acetyltransferase [Trichoplax sp. H2]|eukprot:RDD37138.1 Carnitine O-acetyltransferase [Trichoplax sp. H2]